MSSPDDEVSVWGGGFSPEGREQTHVPQAGSTALQGPGLGSKRYTLVSLGTKESKHTDAGATSVARRAQKAVSVMAMVGEHNDPNRDPVPKGELSTHWAWPSSPWAHHGEPSSDDFHIRDPQDPGNSEPLALNLGEVMPKGPESSDECDQEPTDHSPRLERKQQPPGMLDCPRCLVLQREIDNLKEQLATMQHLADKFQML
ncbi:hypothetical protein CapIbe_023501 [Capra ibex]